MGQTNFLQALGWAVLNSLWQMALLWVVYQLITGINKSARSSFKTSLALILLSSGFAWFLFTLFSIWISSPANTLTFSGAADNNQQLDRWLHLSLPIASIIYLLLLVLPLLHFTRNYRYVQAIRRFGLVKADVRWRMFVDKVSSQMGIQKKVRVWISEFVASPVTVGFLKPVILFPLAAVNRLTPEQFEAILLHELSHIRRYDYLINLVINGIQTILYFNPFVKSFVKTIEREREKSCDEMVMQFEYDPHGYASALLILEKTGSSPKALAVAASGKKNDLLHRVENILGVPRNKVISFNRMAGLFAGLLCVIALNTLLIMNRPGNAHQSGSFVSLSSPFSFFTGGLKTKVKVRPHTQPVQANENDGNEVAINAETTPAQVVNHSPATTPLKSQKAIEANHAPAILPEMMSLPPGYTNVNLVQSVYPVLKHYQEAQVKEAMDASKKVIENIQWKAIENTIADALTQREKDQIKSTYQKELNKVNWDKLENKLRIAYNNLDWEKINEQLGTAVNLIRLDSLRSIYNQQASDLDQVSEELEANNLTGIPDTDISLKEVEAKKVEVQKLLRTIKAARTKKVVHL